MAGSKRIPIDVDLNTRTAIRAASDLNKELRSTDDTLEEVESAGKAMARAMTAAADESIAEIERTKRAVDALELALGDIDADPQQAVGDLKRLGLTAEEIEADADSLADALKRIDDVHVSAKNAGFDDLNKVMGDTETSGRGASVAIGGIGGSISELPGVGSLGPIAESIGQLAEGALEGDINLKGVVGTLGALGAAAGVMWAIGQGAKQASARTEELTESMDDLSSASDELFASTAADLLSQMFMRAALDGKALDEQMQELAETNLVGAKRMLDNAEAIGLSTGAQEMLRSAIAETERAEDQQTATEERYASAADRSADAATAHAEAVADLRAETEDYIAAQEEQLALTEEQYEAEWALVDSGIALGDAQRDLADAIAAQEEVMSNAEATDRERTDAMREVTDAAVRVAESQVRVMEDTAKANGEQLTAVARTDAYRRSLLEQATAMTGPAREAILGRIADIDRIPPAKLTEFHAAIDNGDIATAERILNDASRNRDALIRAEADTNPAEWTLADWRRRQESRPVNVNVHARTMGRQFANGTVNAPAGAHLVGEHGPEIVNLRRGDTVTSAGESARLLRAAGRGGITYVTVIQHLPAGVDPISARRAALAWERRNGPEV